MPGIVQKPITGYTETEYASDWPGLITSAPTSRIPPGACFSCNAAVVRGRLTPQPAIFTVTGTGGCPVTMPTFAAGENVCVMGNLQIPGSQQGFTVIITNIGVYIDYFDLAGSTKAFSKIFTFPTAYPRYARFGTQVISNTLYFSSSAQLGVYALSPTYQVFSVQVVNPGAYFTSAPTVVFSDGGGSGAAATAFITGSSLSSFTMNAFGSGYYVPPIVNLVGGSSAGPQPGEQNAAAIGILAPTPLSYVVREITAFNGVAQVVISAPGSGYKNPTVAFIGGGGTGASATAILAPSGGGIIGITINSPGQGYTSTPTVEIIDSAGTGATANAEMFSGTPFIGGDFMATMSECLILGNIIGGDGNNTVSLQNMILTNPGAGYSAPASVDFVGGGGTGASAYTTESGGAITGINFGTSSGYVAGNAGTGYYSTPAINLLSSTAVTTTATAIAQLGQVVQKASTTTRYPDRIAWSAPNAYGFFDPNYLIAPGGLNTLTEARGLVTSVNVVESVAFVGHNGGITEMTPNTSNAELAFSFYPLWSADEGVVVRYGSMAQYGSTLAFLANDSAYAITPNGLNETGQNIASLLQNCSSWNNGVFPLQGLYGSIVLIEGQKHYLITLSADDWNFEQGNSVRVTKMFDLNMNENSWHTWSYNAYTATCPIYQSFDQITYNFNELARDSWILIALTQDNSSSEDQAVVYEMAPITRTLQLMSLASPPTPLIPMNLNYQFRTEAPSIARMQQERRILIEYENFQQLAALSVTPALNLTYMGQQDPTTQTGTVIQTQESTQNLTQLTAGVAGEILTAQADFGTFTGVCTTLAIFSGGPVSLVRLTQVADLPKGMVP